MIKIIRDKETWDNLVNQCEFADSYHTYDYHIAAKTSQQDPILIHYEEKGKSIVLPLLLRNIDTTKYTDATSVYGYAGPISNASTFRFDIKLFQEELNSTFRDLKLISVFSRLNPFIPNQKSLLHKMGETETLGKIVFIDLNKSFKEQCKGYHSRLRTYVNKFRKLYHIKSITSVEDIESFIELYYENMRRLNAKTEYYFDKKYFLDLQKSSDFKTEILLAIAVKTGEVAGGAMFLKKNKIIQYHLSGSKESYLHANPVKLLIDEMRIRGKQEEYSYLNLGGGLGAKEDTLYYFKSGFSKDNLPFSIWKYIVDQKAYDDLVTKNEILKSSEDTMLFFPRYRMSDH